MSASAKKPLGRVTKKQRKIDRKKKKKEERASLEQYYRAVTGDKGGEQVGKARQMSKVREYHQKQKNKKQWLGNAISGATGQLFLWWVISLMMINIDVVLRLLLVFGSLPALYGLSMLVGRGIPDVVNYKGRPTLQMPPLIQVPPKRIFVTLLVAQLAFLFAQWFAGDSASHKIAAGAKALEVVLVCVLPCLLGLALMMAFLVGFFATLVSQGACGMTNYHQFLAYLLIDGLAVMWTLGQIFVNYIIW